MRTTDPQEGILIPDGVRRRTLEVRDGLRGYALEIEWTGNTYCFTEHSLRDEQWYPVDDLPLTEVKNWHAVIEAAVLWVAQRTRDLM